MGTVYNYSELEILAFFLVLVRMSAFIVSWPVFGVETVPIPIKILFALVTSICVFPIVVYQQVSTELLSMNIIWLVLREAFIGLSIGYLARFFFFALNIAGEMISVSMGLSNAMLFNPALGKQASVIEQFKLALATMFFLAVNGHQLLIAALIKSFDFVPLSNVGINLQHFIGISEAMSRIMEIGIQISAPVVVSVLFMNIAMAVIGRAVPQVNVLITSLPVNILAGFGVMIISIPFIVWQMDGLLDLTTNFVISFAKAY